MKLKKEIIGYVILSLLIIFLVNFLYISKKEESYNESNYNDKAQKIELNQPAKIHKVEDYIDDCNIKDISTIKYYIIEKCSKDYEEEEMVEVYHDERNKKIPLEDMDSNNDGLITFDEYLGEPTLFEYYDDNKDGAIDEEDIEVYYEKIAKGDVIQHKLYQDTIDKFDMNGDGELSTDEVDIPENIFSKIDKNRDFYISLNEIEENPNEFLFIYMQGKKIPFLNPNQAGDNDF